MMTRERRMAQFCLERYEKAIGTRFESLWFSRFVELFHMQANEPSYPEFLRDLI